MTTTLEITDTYESVTGMLFQQAVKFCKKYGGELEDWQSEADAVFMLAWGNFDASKGSKFSSWLYGRLFVCLTDAATRKIKHETREVATDKIDTTPAPQDYVRNLLEDLTWDAATVVLLVLEAPEEIMKEAEARGGKPRNIRSSLRAYLKEAGWTSERVNNAFDEISLKV